MANEELTRKQNDGGPPIDDTLTTDGTADDLSGATVAFTMWQPGQTPKIDENTAQVTIEDAANGEVEFDFADDGSDLDTPGSYLFEWEVTFSNGETRTYPNDREGIGLTIEAEGS